MLTTTCAVQILNLIRESIKFIAEHKIIAFVDLDSCRCLRTYLMLVLSRAPATIVTQRLCVI